MERGPKFCVNARVARERVLAPPLNNYYAVAIDPAGSQFIDYGSFHVKSTHKMDTHHRFCRNLVSTYLTLSDELAWNFSP